MTQVLITLLFFQTLIVFKSDAAQIIRGGVETAPISEVDRQKAQEIIKARCREFGLISRVTGNQDSCLQIATEKTFSPLVAEFCSKISQSQFLKCLNLNQNLNISEHILRVCEGLREGDFMWSPRSECARKLAISKSSYNQKVFLDCFGYLDQTSQSVRTCIELIRDRNVEDHVFERCLPKTNSGNNEWFTCLQNATESVDPIQTPCENSTRSLRSDTLPSSGRSAPATGSRPGRR